MVYSSVPPVVIMDEYVALTLLRTRPIYGSVLDISTGLYMRVFSGRFACMDISVL